MENPKNTKNTKTEKTEIEIHPIDFIALDGINTLDDLLRKSSTLAPVSATPENGELALSFTFKDANRSWWQVSVFFTDGVIDKTEGIFVYDVVFSCMERNERITFEYIGDYPTEHDVLKRLIEYTTGLVFAALPLKNV